MDNVFKLCFHTLLCFCFLFAVSNDDEGVVAPNLTRMKEKRKKVCVCVWLVNKGQEGKKTTSCCISRGFKVKIIF